MHFHEHGVDELDAVVGDASLEFLGHGGCSLPRARCSDVNRGTLRGGLSPAGSGVPCGQQSGAEGPGVVAQFCQSDLDTRPVLGAEQKVAQVVVDA